MWLTILGALALAVVLLLVFAPRKSKVTKVVTLHGPIEAAFEVCAGLFELAIAHFA